MNKMEELFSKKKFFFRDLGLSFGHLFFTQQNNFILFSYVFNVIFKTFILKIYLQKLRKNGDLIF